MGFYPNFMDKFRREYLNHIAKILYPKWFGDTGLDSQRAFIVTYNAIAEGAAKEATTDLALHFDNAEVTLNVSLSEDFDGGELFFGGLWKVKFFSLHCMTSYAYLEVFSIKLTFFLFVSI